MVCAARPDRSGPSAPQMETNSPSRLSLAPQFCPARPSDTMSAMTAYQPVDPAAGLPATRIALSELTGRFLCRRVRSKFGTSTLIELIDEYRRVLCPECHERFDAQILTVEKVADDS